MNRRELMRLVDEGVAIVESLSGGELSRRDEMKAVDRMLEVIDLLGGDAGAPTVDPLAGKSLDQDDFIKSLQAMLGGYEVLSSAVGASFSVAKDADAIKVSAGFSYKYNTPTGFVQANQKELKSFIAKINSGLSPFAKANNFAAGNSMSEAAFLSAIAAAAQRKEDDADSNGDPIYAKSYETIYVDSIFVFDGKAASGGTVQPAPTNPLYQSVLDGAAVTIDLVKQVRAEGQKDPDHPQLRPAVRVIHGAVKAMAA